MITKLYYQQVSTGHLQVFWESSIEGASFTVWKNGSLFLTTYSKSCAIPASPGESVVVEVFDDDSVPGVSFTGRLQLEWDVDPQAVSYRIDQYVDSAWTPRQTVPADGNLRLYWTSQFLADCASHTFRITPVDAYGIDGRSREVIAYIVRPPDAPDAAYSYDKETCKVSITCS